MTASRRYWRNAFSTGTFMKIRVRHVLLSLSIACNGAAFAQASSTGGHSGHGSMPMPMPPAAAPNALFSEDTVAVPAVVPTSEVVLNDGESFVLRAAPAKQDIGGQWIRRLAYNGSVPGPIFRVKQGSTVYVSLKNDTEVETTLHPHGLRLDSRFDGVPGVGQSPIAPGGSFDYELTFPDAGVYWYHPHIREDYTQDAGLYGVFIVEPSDSKTYNMVHREIPVVLDDILVDPNQAFQKEVVTHTLMGRFGNVNLVNGTVQPNFNVSVGEVVRFYVLNSSNTRVFAFSIPGVQLKVVGGDNGLLEKEEWATQVILGPGERTIVEASFTKAGVNSITNAKPKNPAKLAKITVTLGQVALLPTQFNVLRQNTVASSEISKVRALFAKRVDKKLKLTLSMDMGDMGGMEMPGMNMGSGSMPGMNMGSGSMPGMDMGHGSMNMPGMDMGHGSMNMPGMDMGTSADPTAGIEWDDDMADMNSASTNKTVTWKLVDEATGKENMDVKWLLKKGSYVKIRLFNDPKSMHPMQHPIHFHGQRFLVSSINGKVPANLGWKDTVLIPSGSTYEILLEASNPGSWMAHCHISEHMEAGMMFGFDVAE